MTHSPLTALDNLDAFLSRVYSPEEVPHLRGILDRPRESLPLRDYARYLRDRHSKKAKYLETLAALFDAEKKEDNPDANLRAKLTLMEKQLAIPEWCWFVQGNWSIPQGLCSRGRYAAEILIRLLVEPPVCFLYGPMFAPDQWRKQHKRCPSSTLLLFPFEYYLYPYDREQTIFPLMEENGFILVPRLKKYLSVHDMALSTDDSSIMKLNEKGNTMVSVTWRHLDYVEVLRRKGISCSYIQVNLYEKTGNYRTPPVGMHHLMPILSTWRGFTEVMSALEVRLKGFPISSLEDVPQDETPKIVWRKQRRK